MSQLDVPEYFVYGEPARSIEVGFLHVERVRDRNHIHLGKVGAHKHARMAQLTFWTSGRGIYRIEDDEWPFAAPALSLVPSSIVHGFDIEADADAVVISIADDFLTDLEQRAGMRLALPRFVTGGAEAIWDRLHAVIEVIEAEYRDGAGGSDSVMPTLLSAALAYVARLGESQPISATSPEVHLAFALRRLIDEHFRDKWTLGQFAQQLNTTAHLLNKATREVMGMSVKELLLQRRLVEAKRLLLYTIRSVEDIAYDSGFADPAYFSRFFRLHCGEAPAQWRAQNTRR